MCNLKNVYPSAHQPSNFDFANPFMLSNVGTYTCYSACTRDCCCYAGVHAIWVCYCTRNFNYYTTNEVMKLLNQSCTCLT